MLLKMCTVNPSLPQRDLWPFTKVTVHERKRNNWSFWGLLGTCSELTLIPGDPTCLCGPPLRVGTYGGQVVSGVLDQTRLTTSP